MRIALCAPFMEADLLERRIREAVPGEELAIDEYNHVGRLLSLPGLLLYDAVWVAFPGATGLEAVRAVREQSRDVPIVWVSADEAFLAVGAGWRLAMLLTPNSTPRDFRMAVDNSRQRQRRRLIC